jgi:hypothetical protein
MYAKIYNFNPLFYFLFIMNKSKIVDINIIFINRINKMMTGYLRENFNNIFSKNIIKSRLADVPLA